MSTRLDQLRGIQSVSVNGNVYETIKDKLGIQKKTEEDVTKEYKEDVAEAEARYQAEKGAFGEYKKKKRKEGFEGWKQDVAETWDALTANFKGASLGVTLILSLMFAILMFTNVFKIQGSLNYLFASTFIVIMIGVLIKQYPRVYSAVILVFIAMNFFLKFLPFDDIFNVVFGILLISVCIEIIFSSVKIMIFCICTIMLVLLSKGLIIFDLDPQWGTIATYALYIAIIATAIAVLIAQVVKIKNSNLIECTAEECNAMHGVWMSSSGKCSFPKK